MSTPVRMIQLTNDDDDNPSQALIEPLLPSSEGDDVPVVLLPSGTSAGTGTSADMNNSLRETGKDAAISVAVDLI